MIEKDILKYEIIDAFPAFLGFWNDVKNKSIDKQIDAWVHEYMSGWPELLEKQQQDYADQNVDWREIAKQKILALQNFKSTKAFSVLQAWVHKKNFEKFYKIVKETSKQQYI